MITVKIDTASSGDSTLVAADTNRRVFVLGYHFVVTTAVGVKFISGTTDKTGAMACGANGGVSAYSGHPDIPLIVGAVNEAFKINLSGNVQCSGSLTYDLRR